MEIAAATLNPQATYKLLTGVIVPRPIAWVTTISPEGVVNLAPFSAFTFVSTKPPMVGFNCGRKAGVRKDTGRNIHEFGEWVVNIADESLVEQLHLSAIEYESDVSEVDVLGLEVVASHSIRTPRLAAAPISLECRLHRVIEFGQTGSEFVVGEVVMFHIRDSLYEAGKIDSAKLRPICRLGGPNYGKLGDIVSLKPISQTPKTVIEK